MYGMGAEDETADTGNKRRRTSVMYRRKRAVAACGPCRVRKTKCDNVRPACGFCQRNGGRCTYPDTTSDFSTFDPASLAILDRINHVVSLLENRPAVAAEPAPTFPPAYPTLSPASTQRPQLGRDLTVDEDPSPRTDDLPEDDVMIRLDIPDSAASSPNCEAILRWPIFGDAVPYIGSFILELQDDEDFSSGAGAGGTGSFGKGVHEDDFTVLSKKFLCYVHVKNPILDVQDFKSYVKNAGENGPQWDGPSCLVVATSASPVM
ncbi:putative transcriptional regulatory protein [Colletotrichum chlorophyti]|uniref:Putative transcriptional regulatory protein n=1 Tax=Colletotrichum chlorophyti TaxID=708187 RepID=A0A1Q8RT10_9PEZI|nr:putative transcriptional regulatory protein [Colletotrichum chlorophyti]